METHAPNSNNNNRNKQQNMDEINASTISVIEFLENASNAPSNTETSTMDDSLDDISLQLVSPRDEVAVTTEEHEIVPVSTFDVPESAVLTADSQDPPLDTYDDVVSPIDVPESAVLTVDSQDPLLESSFEPTTPPADEPAPPKKST